MANPKTSDARAHEFAEVVRAEGHPMRHLTVDDLKKVVLTIAADLGQCTMLLRDVLELKRGSVVPLNKVAGEMTDILVNGLPLAKGEVVVIGDTLHVRIGEVIGASEKADDKSFE